MPWVVKQKLHISCDTSGQTHEWRKWHPGDECLFKELCGCVSGEGGYREKQCCRCNCIYISAIFYMNLIKTSGKSEIEHWWNLHQQMESKEPESESLGMFQVSTRWKGRGGKSFPFPDVHVWQIQWNPRLFMSKHRSNQV